VSGHPYTAAGNAALLAAEIARFRREEELVEYVGDGEDGNQPRFELEWDLEAEQELIARRWHRTLDTWERLFGAKETTT